MAQVAEIVADLATDLRALSIRSDRDRGTLVELKYERHGSAYLSRIARRLRLLTDDQRDDMLEAAVSSGQLSEADADDVRLADLLFRGRRRTDGGEVVLVVEASGLVDVEDVERAARRAAHLVGAGLVAMAVVVGDSIAPRAVESARRKAVWMVLNGRAQPPDAA